MVLTQILPSPPEGDEISTGVIEDSARAKHSNNPARTGATNSVAFLRSDATPPDGSPASRRNLHNVALHSCHHAERNLTMVRGDAVSDLL